MTTKFRVWNDGPICEAWDVTLGVGRTVVYCAEPATADEVRAEAERLYAAAYKGVRAVVRMATLPTYCTPAN